MGAYIKMEKNYNMETNMLGELIPDDENAYTWTATIDGEGGGRLNVITIHGLISNEESESFYSDWFNTRDGDDMRKAAGAAIAYDNVQGTKLYQAKALLEFVHKHMMEM